MHAVPLEKVGPVCSACTDGIRPFRPLGASHETERFLELRQERSMVDFALFKHSTFRGSVFAMIVEFPICCFFPSYNARPTRVVCCGAGEPCISCCGIHKCSLFNPDSHNLATRLSPFLSGSCPQIQIPERQ